MSARLDRIAEVMKLIAADCEADALALDGKPFDGRSVAEQFGNVLAAVKAVAIAVQVLAENLNQQAIGNGSNAGDSLSVQGVEAGFEAQL